MNKNKILLQFIFISAIHATGIAQQDKIADSLLNVLKTQKEDTNRVKTLNGLSRRFLMKEYELSNKYAKDAISLSEKLNFKKGSIIAYSYLGLNNRRLGNYKEAMENHQASLKFAEETGNKSSAGVAYSNIGAIYFDQGNMTEALKNFFTSAKLHEESGDKRNASISYYNIGNTYYSPLCNYVESIKAHTISLNLATEIGWKSKMGGSHIDIGNSYESLGNYPEALKHYLKAFTLSQEAANKDNVASSCNNIGEIYNNQGQYTEALKYYIEGLRVYEETKNKYGISVSFDNIGEIYQKQGKFTEALKNHHAALKIHEERKYPFGMAYSYRNIGNVYFLQSDYAEALKNYFSSIALFKKIEENEGISKLNRNIGDTYLRMNNFPEARKYLNEALSGAKQFQGKRIIKETYENLAKLDSAAGNWETAYENQKLFALYRDSLLNEESSNRITEMMMQFEFDKKEDSLKYQQALTDEKLKQQQLLASQQSQSLLLKENEVALLNNEKLLLNKEKDLQDLQLQNNATELAIQKAESETKQNQVLLLNKENDIQTLQIKKQKQFRNYLLIGFALLILTAFFAYYSYRTRQQLKLQKLRNKIASDLHDDVGSTLSSISMFSQMAQQQSKEMNPLLDSIGDYSRKMLDAMADIVWTINPENDQFEQIILRMRNFAYDLLGTKNIEFEFDADEDVTNMKLSMDVRKNIYLIFKEATNNMAKYSEADQALFRIKNEKHNLIMVIHDNGKGFNTSQATNGNGLRNMRKRAEEMRADLTIESGSGKGTTIELSIAV